MDILIIVLLMALVGAVFFLINKKNDNGQSQEFLLRLNENLINKVDAVRKELSENSEKGRKEIDDKLKDINKEINEFHKSSKSDIQKQFADSNKVITAVTQELEKIKGTNEQVLNFANQMKTLEKILSNQKQRGILGEIQLENLLANVLPPELFQMQYSFSSGEAVDAIVKVGDFIIPIDAKFSLDNYNKMIESSDKTEIEGLEKNSKRILKVELTKQRNISDQEKTQRITHTCLYLLMACTKIY